MNIFRKIHSLLTPSERKSAFILFGLMIIGMLLETLGVGLIVPLVTLMMQGDLIIRYPAMQPLFEFFGNPSQEQLVVGAMLSLIGIYLVKNLFLAFLAWRQMCFAYGIQRHLSQRLFTMYLRQPYSFHLQRNSAQLVRNVTGEVSLFTGAVNNSLNILTEGLVLLGVAGLLLLVEPQGALIVASVLGVVAWAFYRGNRARITRWGVARQHHEGLRLQHLQQGLGGVKDVKLLGRESDFLEQFQVHNTQSVNVAQLQATLQQLPRLWLELLAVSGLVILVLSMISHGRDMTSIVPTLALFAAAAFKLMPSVNRVLSAMQTLRYGLPVINTLNDELKQEVPDAIVQSYTNAFTFSREISLTDISYTYESASLPALNGLSLSIRKGEFVGFIGTSGSGKSTLVDVLLGLLTPSNGLVEVDGNDIQSGLRQWQNQIGYVPQSIYLTDDTLRRNVAFGIPNEQIDDVAVQRAIKAAQLEEFVMSSPDGFETVVGERGVRLSGGQRQRIGIARALYHDPAVLVLDEATSALDSETERGVMEAVSALHGSSKTIIVVAHRLSTVVKCDRLFRLELGKVVDEGLPEEMLSFQKSTFSAWQPI